MLRQESGWTNPKILALFTVIFLCGAAFGSVAMREILHSRFGDIRHNNSMEAVKDAVKTGGVARLKSELNLTPDQEKIVLQELDVYAKYYQNIEEQQADIEQQRKNVAELGKQRILSVLNDDQKRRFNQLFNNNGGRR
jgi:hypothetical protein